MKTLEYLKRYAYYYFYILTIVAVLVFAVDQTSTQVSTIQQQRLRPTIIIDPGHGGMDGGTTSSAGTGESGLNLEISLRLNDLLRLLGYDTMMTRTEDISLTTEGDTVRAQKTSDLKNRVKMVNAQENALLLSVHQNYFPQSKYFGPQVFYAAGSETLAEQMQSQLNTALAPQSNRACKKAEGVYLMENINKTGILVECGFLSNAAEEAKLKQPDYQKKLCCAIGAVMANYIEKGTLN